MSGSLSRASDPAGYLSNKTIAALCTPTGGAICVLRISGSEAFSIANRLIQSSVQDLGARVASRVWLYGAEGKKLDDAVVVSFLNPKSFTGEDVVEFFLHGSPIIAQKVLDQIFEYGARLALPGEFSFRAVKNGKMTLSQAEAVKEIISAENDFALELALEKLSGSQHALIDRVRTELIQLITLGEVGIDFSDQDIDEVSLPRLKTRLKMILQLLTELQGSFDRGKRFQDGVPVAIFGLPNAGKSSFFNVLLGEDRSIVSDIAGTTRDVVREKLNLKGKGGYITFRLSDTAGLRKSGDVVESMGIERSLKAAKDSDFILVVLDGTNLNLTEVSAFLNQVDLTKKTALGIVTKKDLIAEAEQGSVLKSLGSLPVSSWQWISSKTHEGVHSVAEKMAAEAEKYLARKPGEVLLTRFEHVQAVEKALVSLKQAEIANDLVLFAADLRHAVGELGPLIGETLPDDVLGKIFSDFCIGK